ncbi:uncharacterized protein LOC122079586 [Macadamia integrifolia]|uniref:uncharacterized protein LOC122079586 n=1 Tax=Macadamia integrifolia TaxID=60698 RepID=UPI001C4EB34A|nr:uncharacterized protein LOC122079586 [Macadamia integrifolia]
METTPTLPPAHSALSQVQASSFAERLAEEFASKLELPNMKPDPVEVSEETLLKADQSLQYSIVVWVLDGVHISIMELRAMFSRAEHSKPIRGFELHLVDNAPDRFVIKLRNERDMQVILLSQPWIYAGHATILQKWNPEMPAEQVIFPMVVLWVQVEGEEGPNSFLPSYAMPTMAVRMSSLSFLLSIFSNFPIGVYFGFAVV